MDSQAQSHDDYRQESDALGKVDVPRCALYGVHTTRALKNFPLGRERSLGDFPLLVKGLLMVKAAAVLANYRCGIVNENICNGVRKAVGHLISEYDPLHYPIHHLHGGGGTSANMNVNEVIANQVEELLGGKRGAYRLVSPLEIVNLNQSTNDVFPTACHLALIWAGDSLQEKVVELLNVFKNLANNARNIKRMAKSCLQDALEISYGDLFDGYCAVIGRSIERIQIAVDGLFSINLGGTMVGRREDVPLSYFEQILPILREDTGLIKLKRHGNLFDAAQNLDDMVNLSNQLALFSRSLIKICKDIRLLASGPEFGFRELSLSLVQEGSSFKPGKNNPVVPEFIIQSCFAILGNDTACSASIEHSDLDVSVWESLAVFKTLNSMEILESVVSTFQDRCLTGIRLTPRY
ncbi:MAG: lyase family protein [Pseudomonadota bacterium]